MTKVQKRVMVALCLMALVVSSYQLTNAIIAYIMMSYPDLSSTTVTQILTIPGLVGLVVSLVIGPLALKVKKKTLLLVSGLALLAYYLIFALVGANGPFALLLVAAGLVGITQGAALTLISASIADFFPEDKRAKNMAMTNAVMNIGAALMSLLGGLVAAANGGQSWSNAYWLGLVVAPVLVLFVILMPSKPEERADATDAAADAAPVEKRKTKIKIPGRVIGITLFNMLFSLCFCVFLYNISSYVITAHALGTSAESGLATSLCTLLGIVAGFSYPFWEKLFKKYVIVFGFAMMALGFFLMVQFPSLVVGAYIGSAVIGFAFYLCLPYTMSAVMGAAPAAMAPVAMSVFMVGTNLMNYIAPFLLNVLSVPFGGGVDGTIWVGCILMIVNAVLAIPIYVKGGKKQTAELGGDVRIDA